MAMEPELVVELAAMGARRLRREGKPVTGDNLAVALRAVFEEATHHIVAVCFGVEGGRKRRRKAKGAA